MRPEVVLLLAIGASAVIAAAFVSRQGKADARDGINTRKRTKRRKAAAAASAYHRGMSEQEYTPLIPQKELRQLQNLLDTVYAARGWQHSRAQCAAAWETLLTQAMSPEGGAWEAHLPVTSMEPDRLQALSFLLDRTFLGGQVQGWLVQQGRQAVRFQPVSHVPGPDDWYANFFTQHNTVGLKRGKWAEEVLVVTPQCPADYEGLQCTCRLQVLLHTLGHELVHALVYHRLPLMDAASPAYRVDDCHGPTFRLLSAKLFGHVTEDFKRSRTRG